MFYRILFGAIPALLALGIISGALPISSLWGSSSFSTTVPHSTAEVVDALSDFKLEPGAENPLQGQRTADGYVWTLGYRDKPTTNLIVHLESTDGGQSTRITSEIQQLPAAADGDVPPIFRTGFAADMFNAALEEELNPLQPDDRRLSDGDARTRHVHEIDLVENDYAANAGLADIERSAAQ